MATDAQLAFADQAGSFYAREYGFPPVTGRVLGYLTVCDPAQQTINELAETLLASRSAITGAVRQLEGFHAVRRTRAAGDRLDRVSLDPAACSPRASPRPPTWSRPRWPGRRWPWWRTRPRSGAPC